MRNERSHHTQTHRHIRNYLLNLLLAVVAGTAWAGDKPETADPEHVEAAVEDAAAEADDGRTDPRESWMSGTPAAESAANDRPKENAHGGMADDKIEAGEKLDDVVEDAAAEVDDGRTSPREADKKNKEDT